MLQYKEVAINVVQYDFYCVVRIFERVVCQKRDLIALFKLQNKDNNGSKVSYLFSPIIFIEVELSPLRA